MAKSANELSKKPIHILGQNRYFKETPNESLINCTERLDELREEMQDKNEEVEDLQKQVTRKREVAQDLLDESQLIMKKQDITNKDIQLVRTNKEQAYTLQDEADDLEKGFKERGKELTEELKALQDKMMDEYDKICQLMLTPYEPGEFQAKYDNRDLAKMNSIQALYDMHFEEFADAKIQQRIKQVINASHDQLFGQFQSGEEL